ncbi:MAG: DUF1460 domain-containing protein [Alphaproteobacteria bacterium]|nr:DUF1460 domain-containing protein [Alphaproteobacteria bacterium]
MWRLFLLLFILAGCGGDGAEFPGQSYLGTRYENSPLGECNPPDDGPLIRFDAFDCTTFVETVLADGCECCLTEIRYKNGEIGFLSRNHFIESDWLNNNSDFVQNVSSQYAPTAVRRVIIDKANWFRVVHGLDVDVAPVVVDLEYIPYEYFNEIIIQGPVIVLFITDNPKNRDKIGTDLAVVHMGLWLPNGVLRHASSERGMVVDVDMADYVAQRMKNKQNLGIAVVEIK